MRGIVAETWTSPAQDWRLLSMVLVSLILGGCAEESREPNHLILVSIDTLRADFLGCYGHPFVQSPHLDQLAENGVRFHTHISAAPSTLSSHTSLMTGTYPQRHGVARNGFRVPDDNETLAEVLVGAGFRTAAFIGAAPLGPAVNFHQGFQHYDGSSAFTLRGDERNPSGVERPASDVTDSVLAWLDSEDSSFDDRLFLFVHYFDVHHPYQAPPPYAGMYGRHPYDSISERQRVWIDVTKKLEAEGAQDLEQHYHDVRPQLFELEGRGKTLAAAYAEEITYTDAEIGRLFEGLRSRGLWNDALVVVTSDHGETMLEHSPVFDHGATVYDTEVRTPLLFRLPDERLAGTVIAPLVSATDVFPTVLDFLGVPHSHEVDGQSLRTLMQAGKETTPRFAFSEATKPFREERFDSHPRWRNLDKFRSVRNDRYKLMIRIPDRQIRLYDLESDPWETTNLILSGEYDQDVLSEMRQQLDNWTAQARPFRSDMVELKEQLDALRELGYLED